MGVRMSFRDVSAESSEFGRPPEPCAPGREVHLESPPQDGQLTREPSSIPK